MGTATEYCYRVPEGVEFLRWNGGEEWVVYHSGTGETLRLSEGALAIIDLLARRQDPVSQIDIMRELAAMMDEQAEESAMVLAVSELLRVLIGHECVDPVLCD
jgi:hypothetical protein